jgi:hypothetical protein
MSEHSFVSVYCFHKAAYKIIIYLYNLCSTNSDVAMVMSEEMLHN